MTDRHLKYLKAFRNLGPPTYAGNNSDPLEAEDWLRRVTKCLDAIKAPDELRVDFATFMLTGDADRWWEFTKRGCHVGAISWEEFKRRFRIMYGVKTFEYDQKAQQFAFLIQDFKTVAQYVAEFIHLSEYGDAFGGEEHLKIEKFIKGLKSSIREGVAALKYDTFEDAVNEAYKVEKYGGRKIITADDLFGEAFRSLIYVPTNANSMSVKNAQKSFS